jgi:hypothetical protein
MRSVEHLVGSTSAISPRKARLLRRDTPRDPQGNEARPAQTDACTNGRNTVKGSQKPKKLGKKPAQKTLKERRVEKRAAAKLTRSLDI